jgi:tight adherence protein C
MVIFALVGVEELIPLLVFAGLVAFIFAMLSMISNRNSKAQERLERLSRPTSMSDIDDAKEKKERFQTVMEAASRCPGRSCRKPSWSSPS